jgi:glucokinase
VTGKAAGGVKEIAAEAPHNPGVMALFDEFGNRLGTFLAPWLSRFGAEILVAGGNISHAWDQFGPSFEAALKRSGCSTATAISELKEDAALLGSAYLLDDDFWKAVQPALSLM